MTETARRAPAAQRHGDDTESEPSAVLAPPGRADGVEGRHLDHPVPDLAAAYERRARRADAAATSATRQDEPPRPVVIWHRIHGGQACATPLDTATAQLPYADLARLIARRILDDPQARLAVDHVLTLPPNSPLLSGAMRSLALDEEALEPAAQLAPEVADPATGAVRVTIYAGSNSPC